MSHPRDPQPALSDAELAELAEEMPRLADIRALTDQACRLPWFANVGEPLDRATRQLADSYLDALGFPDIVTAPLADWDEASEAALSLDWHTNAWEAEEQLRAGLTVDALDSLSEEALNIALTNLTARLQDQIASGVEEAAALWDLADEALINAAVGSGVQAAYNAALVVAAGAGEDHPLWLKFQLFARGRWPVGVAGSSFNLF